MVKRPEARDSRAVTSSRREGDSRGAEVAGEELDLRAVAPGTGLQPLEKQAERTETPTIGFSNLLITRQSHLCLNPARSQEARVCPMQPTQDTELVGEAWGADLGQQT